MSEIAKWSGSLRAAALRNTIKILHFGAEWFSRQANVRRLPGIIL